MKTITALGFGASRHVFRVRALTFDELHKIVLSARQSDWIGNEGVIHSIVRAGLNDREDDIQLASKDVFLLRNLAREIWIVSLREIEKRAQRLARLGDERVKVWRVRRYEFVDIATPSMLFLIARDCSRCDVGALARAWVEATTTIYYKGKPASAAKRRELLKKDIEWFIKTSLEARGVGTLFDDLPHTVLPTPAHRLYAVLALTATPDWQQYRLVIDGFNYAVQGLVWRSNQLGGVVVPREQVKLNTGVAMMLDFVQPERSVPIRLIPRLFFDADRDSLGGFAPAHRRILHAAARAGFKDIAARMQGDSGMAEDEKRTVAAKALLNFGAAVSRYPKLVERSCFVYNQEYSEYAHDRLEKRVKEALAETALSFPDSYLLVEGPSDEIYFQGVIARHDIGSVRIGVVDCGGAPGVLRRARAILADQREASVITVFDNDARSEHREAERLFQDRARCRSFLLERGAIEEEIPDNLHFAALHRALGIGRQQVKGIDPAKPVFQEVKRIVWETTRTSLEKVAHARSVVAEMAVSGDRPESLFSIGAAAIDFAKDARTRRALPIPVLDRLIRESSKRAEAKGAAEGEKGKEWKKRLRPR